MLEKESLAKEEAARIEQLKIEEEAAKAK